MNPRATAVALAVVVLAACTSALTPSGTPTSAPSGTPPPTPTSSSTPTITRAPTLEPTTTPTRAPTPSPTIQPTPLADWTGPELIGAGEFNETDVAVDPHGSVHVAAAGSGADNRGIWYFTNASGGWASRQVSSPPPADDGEQGDGEPSIAIDTNGSVWIAFARWTCWQCAPDSPDGTWYVTNASGTWSEPRQIARDASVGPSLVVRDGIVHVAYNERTNLGHGEDHPIWYSTNASGTWVATKVARKGSSPQLSVDAAGRVQILYGAPNDIRLVTQRPSGDFGAPEALPGSTGESGFEMAVDAGDGGMWAGWSELTADDNSSNVIVARHSPAGWSQPELAITGGRIRGLAVDGLVNVTASAAGPDAIDELIYAWNAHPDHSFHKDQLAWAGGLYSSIATGPLGRAYVVYVIEDPNVAQPGVWLRMHLLPAEA